MERTILSPKIVDKTFGFTFVARLFRSWKNDF